jgi:hypothetical protein
MDNYPKRLRPKGSGRGKEPFDQWWERARSAFKNVPENVAQYWLYEHWDQLPYRYLKSQNYSFDLVRWPAAKLAEILTTWNRFDPDHAKCISHGRGLVEDWEFNEPYLTADYMVEHGNFPAPIIVLDNRDGHVGAGESDDALPAAYVLTEGHRRLNLALYLQSTNKLKSEVDVWLMTRILT